MSGQNTIVVLLLNACIIVQHQLLKFPRAAKPKSGRGDKQGCAAMSGPTNLGCNFGLGLANRFDDYSSNGHGVNALRHTVHPIIHQVHLHASYTC